MAQPVGSYTNPLKKFKLVFLGEQSGMTQAHDTVVRYAIAILTV